VIGEKPFQDDLDRRLFLKTLAEACEKTDWQVRVVFNENHFHVVLETPQPIWLRYEVVSGTYTGRFNRRHKILAISSADIQRCWWTG
jgi:hypothetical protein